MFATKRFDMLLSVYEKKCNESVCNDAGGNDCRICT